MYVVKIINSPYVHFIYWKEISFSWSRNHNGKLINIWVKNNTLVCIWSRYFLLLSIKNWKNCNKIIWYDNKPVTIYPKNSLFSVNIPKGVNLIEFWYNCSWKPNSFVHTLSFALFKFLPKCLWALDIFDASWNVTNHDLDR